MIADQSGMLAACGFALRIIRQNTNTGYIQLPCDKPLGIRWDLT